jgi:hypothetical protein
LEPAEAAQLGAPVGAGADVDVVAGLFPQPPERGGVFAPVELVAEGFAGGAFGGRPAHDLPEDFDGFEGPLVAVAGGGGVGDHADPVLVAAAGDADVEVLGAGGGVGDEDGSVDGEAFGFADGDGVGQRDVVGGVVGGEDNPAVAVEVGDDQCAVVAAGGDVPAVAVADP